MKRDNEVRAIRFREPGGPEVLESIRVPLPPPREGHLRVRVVSSGVNRADLVQRMGRYPPPPGSPEEILGLEYAGRVEALGPGCRLREVGEPIMGIVGGGGYAEAMNVPEAETIRISPRVDPVEAGAIPEVFITAWDALMGQARLQAGETLLIHAVGSGVGTAALQLALAAGARPLGTSRTPEKLSRAGKMGLHRGIVADEDWPEAVLEQTDGRGADVILDLVGASYLEGNLAVLAPGARWIVVGVPGGSRGSVDLRRLMSRRATMRGTVLRPRSSAEKAILARDFESRIVPLFDEGKLRPVVDTVFGPDEVAEAHRRMEASRTFGKLLIGW